MKIEQLDGNTIETDKLSDSDAMVLEKSEELWQLCVNHGRQMFLTVNGKVKKNGKVECFFTHLTPGAESLTVEEDREFLDVLMGSVSNCVQKVTGGEYSVTKNLNS